MYPVIFLRLRKAGSSKTGQLVKCKNDKEMEGNEYFELITVLRASIAVIAPMSGYVLHALHILC